MIGLAVGDALGAAAEFLSERQVHETYGVLRDYQPTPYFDVGEYTDDTSMALAIAESIVAADCVDAEAMADAFVQWMHSDGRGIGSLTLESLRLIDEGHAPLESSRRAWERSGRSSAGNGAVMRCAPVGLYDWRDSESLVRDSLLCSQVTHYDPRCCWSCVAVNSAIAALLGDADPLRAARRAVAGKCSELEGALDDAVHESLGSMRLDGGDKGYTILTTRAAFVALRQFDSFEEGVVAVVNKGGDADTNGAVTGALLGAKFGLDAIPTRWVTGLKGRERLLSTADTLCDLMANTDN